MLVLSFAPMSVPGEAAAAGETASINAAALAGTVPVRRAAASKPSSVMAAKPALYAASKGRDRAGRVLATVHINDRGPFRFVVDTGANHTAISKRLAATLGLRLDSSSTVEVHGITGSANVPMVHGTRLKVGELELELRRLPILDDRVFADADGILGVEGLRDSRVEFDFVNDRVTVRESTGRGAPDDRFVVPARFAKGGLMLVRGSIGRVQSELIIDTGAERTMGNLALHRALLKTMRPQEIIDATIVGATPGTVAANSMKAPPIAIGDARLDDVAVTFADLHVFQLWGLTGVPALVVGMDVLGSVDRFVVDYGRHEFQIRPRSSGQVVPRECAGGTCGSRLPRR